MGRGLAAAVAALIMLPACAPDQPIGVGSKPPRKISGSTPTSTPSAAGSGSATPGPATEISFEPRSRLETELEPEDPRPTDREGWVRYRSIAIGIEVPFPLIPGETREVIHSSDWNRHRLFSWTTWYPGFEPYEESGYPEHRTVYGFAGGTSSRASEARGCGLTDTAGWTRRGSTYRVLGPNGACEYDVEDPIDVIRRDDGAAALLFYEREFLDGFCCHGKDLVAILRFPDDHHPEFDAILFHFDNFDDGPTYDRPEPEPALPGFTLDDARSVIRGVRFFTPSASGMGGGG